MELSDKIVQMIDDRENQGETTTAKQVAEHFSLPFIDAIAELSELLDSGRIEMDYEEHLSVTML